MCVYLVEYEGLADVSPAAGGGPVVEEEEQQQQHDDAGRGVHRVDDEHHHQAAEDAQQAGVPGEQLERRPARGKPGGKCSFLLSSILLLLKDT